MEFQQLLHNTPSQSTIQPKTLICVTDQMRCDRIIRAGRLLANLMTTPLSVISIASTQIPQDPNSIEHLFNVSKQSGADMSVIYSDDPAKAIIKYIKENKISNVLTGQPVDDDSMLYRIWGKFTHINFFTVDEEGALIEIARQTKGSGVFA